MLENDELLDLEFDLQVRTYSLDLGHLWNPNTPDKYISGEAFILPKLHYIHIVHSAHTLWRVA